MEAGARVHSPTLTGLGDRANLLSPTISLQDHIADVLRAFEDKSLNDVVLVGHSYSGMVVTAVANLLASRLARVVYLDAIVPLGGQCLFDCTSQEFRQRIDEQVVAQGEGWFVPTPTPQFLGLSQASDISWVMPKLVPHPYRTFRDAVPADIERASAVPRAYINCIGDKPRGGPRSPQSAGIDDYFELSCGHDAMVTAPLELAELLGKFG